MKDSFEKVLVKPVFFFPVLFLFYFLFRAKDLAMNCTATMTHLQEVNCLKNETSWCLWWLASKKTIFDSDTSCVTEANKTIVLQVLHQQDAVLFSKSLDM